MNVCELLICGYQTIIVFMSLNLVYLNVHSTLHLVYFLNTVGYYIFIIMLCAEKLVNSLENSLEHFITETS